MRMIDRTCVAPVITAVAIAAAALVGCAQRDDSDPPGERSGMIVFTDHLTGCQYLSLPAIPGLVAASLHQRMRADGTQVCTNADDRKSDILAVPLDQ